MDFSKRQAEEIVNVLFDILKKGIKSGEDVTIAGVGTFTLVERKERKGKNPLYLLLVPLFFGFPL
ncbi:MAG: HU family DNA-binding protein [Desulfonauticus sp.]|nr:HU family DNA-binding protein [Desulfonauticus sp.]